MEIYQIDVAKNQKNKTQIMKILKPSMAPALGKLLDLPGETKLYVVFADSDEEVRQAVSDIGNKLVLEKEIDVLSMDFEIDVVKKVSLGNVSAEVTNAALDYVQEVENEDDVVSITRQPGNIKYMRLDRGEMPDGLQAARDEDDVDFEQYDSITLQVPFLPTKPYIQNGKGVVGDARKVDAVINELFSEDFSAGKKNASTYTTHECGDKGDFKRRQTVLTSLKELLELKEKVERVLIEDKKLVSPRLLASLLAMEVKDLEKESSLDELDEDELQKIEEQIDSLESAIDFFKTVEEEKGKDAQVNLKPDMQKIAKKQLEKLTAREKELKSQIRSLEKHNPEWLHTIANSLGAPLQLYNASAGSYAANTQMAVIENAIARQPGIGVEVTVYHKPGTQIAQWYTYTVVAHGSKEKITFEIDATRDWYNEDDFNFDENLIKEFLKETKDARENFVKECTESLQIDSIDKSEEELNQDEKIRKLYGDFGGQTVALLEIKAVSAEDPKYKPGIPSAKMSNKTAIWEPSYDEEELDSDDEILASPDEDLLRRDYSEIRETKRGRPTYGIEFSSYATFQSKSALANEEAISIETKTQPKSPKLSELKRSRSESEEELLSQPPTKKQKKETIADKQKAIAQELKSMKITHQSPAAAPTEPKWIGVREHRAQYTPEQRTQREESREQRFAEFAALHEESEEEISDDFDFNTVIFPATDEQENSFEVDDELPDDPEIHSSSVEDEAKSSSENEMETEFSEEQQVDTSTHGFNKSLG